nr:phage tail tip lysozyme [Nocardiopsis algeriensis]
MAVTGGGGAGGVQPPGSASDASDQVGQAARKVAPDAGDTARTDGAQGVPGTEGADTEQAANPLKDPTGAAGRDTPELGAGGTSEAAKGGPESDKGGVAKGAGAVAAVPAIGVGAQLMVLMMFLNWLKGLLLAIAAMVMNLLNLLWTLVVAAFKAVAGFALAVGAAIASAVGGAISAVTGAALSIGAAVMAVISLAVGTSHTVQEGQAIAQRDALPEDCRPMTEATVREIDGNTRSGADTADMEATAEEIYSILAGMGMQDENIAGVLGNFQQESRIDPTAVETIYTEPYKVGPRKREAEENGFQVELIDSDYAATWPAIDLVGIGLGQWTNGRNTMLTDYADSTGGKWWDVETQLSFMISDDDPARVRFVKELIEDSSGSIEESTRDWMVEWEGLSLSVAVNRPRLTERQEYAAVWFAKMEDWEADKERAGSILDQARTTVDAANQDRRSAVVQECRTADVDGAKGDVVSAGEQIPCASLGRMHPDACRLHEHLQEEFGGFFLSAGGQRNEQGSNHNNGQAIDYMMAPLGSVPSEDMHETGMTIVNYLIPRAEEFNIKGILWDGRKWATGNDPVGPWNNETTRYAGGRGNNTQNHVDHIHISVGPDRFM